LIAFFEFGYAAEELADARAVTAGCGSYIKIHLVTLSLALGIALGNRLNEELDISGQASDLGIEAEGWAHDLGAPDMLANSLGGAVTIGSALSLTTAAMIFPSWMWEDD
jgi:hypothetical protein